MPERDQIIYQSRTIYIGPSEATGYHLDISGVGVPYSDLSAVSAAGSNSVTGFIGDEDYAAGPITNRIKQLHRVQSFNHDYAVSRQFVNQFGELAQIDNQILDTPTVSVDLTYLLSNMANEEALGFDIGGQQSALTNIINRNQEEKNIFAKTVAEGVDSIGGGVDPANTDAVGIGNAFLTSYSTEAAVGSFPTVSVSFEALNIGFQTGVTGNRIPAVNPANGNRMTALGADSNTYNITYDLPEAVSNVSGLTTGVADISVLRPGDVSMTFSKVGGGTYDALGAKIESSTAKLQSYNLSFDLSRTAIEKLGSKFAFTRKIDFPVNISLSVDAIVDELRTGDLIDVLDCDEEYNVEINIKNPDTCAGDGNLDIAKYIVRNLTLDSQNYSLSIGDRETVTLNFTSQVGGPNQTGVGIFMSGRGFDLGLS